MEQRDNIKIVPKESDLNVRGGVSDSSDYVHLSGTINVDNINMPIGTEAAVGGVQGGSRIKELQKYNKFMSELDKYKLQPGYRIDNIVAKVAELVAYDIQGTSGRLGSSTPAVGGDLTNAFITIRDSGYTPDKLSELVNSWSADKSKYVKVADATKFLMSRGYLMFGIDGLDNIDLHGQRVTERERIKESAKIVKDSGYDWGSLLKMTMVAWEKANPDNSRVLSAVNTMTKYGINYKDLYQQGGEYKIVDYLKDTYKEKDSRGVKESVDKLKKVGFSSPYMDEINKAYKADPSLVPYVLGEVGKSVIDYTGGKERDYLSNYVYDNIKKGQDETSIANVLSRAGYSEDKINATGLRGESAQATALANLMKSGYKPNITRAKELITRGKTPSEVTEIFRQEGYSDSQIRYFVNPELFDLPTASVFNMFTGKQEMVTEAERDARLSADARVTNWKELMEHPELYFSSVIPFDPQVQFDFGEFLGGQRDINATSQRVFPITGFGHLRTFAELPESDQKAILAKRASIGGVEKYYGTDNEGRVAKFDNAGMAFDAFYTMFGYYPGEMSEVSSYSDNEKKGISAQWVNIAAAYSLGEGRTGGEGNMSGSVSGAIAAGMAAGMSQEDAAKAVAALGVDGFMSSAVGPKGNVSAFTALTPAMLTEAMSKVAAGNSFNVAAALAEDGFTEAAKQVGGRKDIGGVWDLPTAAQKATEAMGTLLDDTKQRYNEKGQPLSIVWGKKADGSWGFNENTIGMGMPSVGAIFSPTTTLGYQREITIIDPKLLKDGTKSSLYNTPITFQQFSDGVINGSIMTTDGAKEYARKENDRARTSCTATQERLRATDSVLAKVTDQIIINSTDDSGVTDYIQAEERINSLLNTIFRIQGTKIGETVTIGWGKDGKPINKVISDEGMRAQEFSSAIMRAYNEGAKAVDATDYKALAESILSNVSAQKEYFKEKLKKESGQVVTNYTEYVDSLEKQFLKGTQKDYKGFYTAVAQAIEDNRTGAKPMPGAPASIRGDVGTIDFTPTTEGDGADSSITPSVDTQVAVPASITPSSSKAVSITRRADGTILAVMKNNQAYVIKPDGTWTKYNTVSDEKRGSSYGVCTNGSCKLSDSKAANAIIADIEKSGGLKPTATQPISKAPFTAEVSADVNAKPPAQKTEVVKDGLGNFVVKYIFEGDGYRLKYDANGKIKGFDYDLKNTGNWLPLTANNLDLKNKAVACGAGSCKDMSKGLKPGMEWVEGQFQLNKTLNVGILDATTFTTAPITEALTGEVKYFTTNLIDTTPDLYQSEKNKKEAEGAIIGEELYGGTTKDGTVLTMPKDRYLSLNEMGKFLFDTGGFAQLEKWAHAAGEAFPSNYPEAIGLKKDIWQSIPYVKQGEIISSTDPLKSFNEWVSGTTRTQLVDNKAVTELDDGSIISADLFEGLDNNYKVVLKTLGIDGYNKYWEDNHIKLPDGESLSKDYFQTLTVPEQEAVLKEGISGAFVKGADNSILPKSIFNGLDTENQNKYLQFGLKDIKVNEVKISGLEGYKLKDGGYDLFSWASDANTKGMKYSQIESTLRGSFNNNEYITEVLKTIPTDKYLPDDAFNKLGASEIVVYAKAHPDDPRVKDNWAISTTIEGNTSPLPVTYRTWAEANKVATYKGDAKWAMQASSEGADFMKRVAQWEAAGRKVTETIPSVPLQIRIHEMFPSLNLPKIIIANDPSVISGQLIRPALFVGTEPYSTEAKDIKSGLAKYREVMGKIGDAVPLLGTQEQLDKWLESDKEQKIQQWTYGKAFSEIKPTDMPIRTRQEAEKIYNQGDLGVGMANVVRMAWEAAKTMPEIPFIVAEQFDELGAGDKQKLVDIAMTAGGVILAPKQVVDTSLGELAAGKPWKAGGQLVGFGVAMFVTPEAVIKGTRAGVLDIYSTVRGLKGKELLPRGMNPRTDIPFADLPPVFDVVGALTKAKLQNIYKLPPEVQRLKARETLNPYQQYIYDGVLETIDTLSESPLPRHSMLKNIDFSKMVKTLPDPRGARGIKEVFRKHGKEVRAEGSAQDIAFIGGDPKLMAKFGLGGDIDVVVSDRWTNADKIKLAKEFADAYNRDTNAGYKSVNEKVFTNTGEKAIEIHNETQFKGRQPIFGFEELINHEPINIDGVYFGDVRNQMFRRGREVVRPGVGEGTGMMGVPYSGKEHLGRPKDQPRFALIAEALIDELELQTGDTALVNKLRQDVRNIFEAPRGYPKPVGLDLHKVFMEEYMNPIQELVMQAGRDGRKLLSYTEVQRIISERPPYLKDMIKNVPEEMTREMESYGTWADSKGIPREQIYVQYAKIAKPYGYKMVKINEEFWVFPEKSPDLKDAIAWIKREDEITGRAYVAQVMRKIDERAQRLAIEQVTEKVPSVLTQEAQDLIQLKGLVDRIEKGETSFTPEELQLQANYSKELEAILKERVEKAKINEPSSVQRVILTRDKNGVEVYEGDKLFYDKPDGTRVQVDLTIKDGIMTHDAIPTVIDGKEVWLHNFKDTEGNAYFQVNRDRLVVEKVAQPSIETAPSGMVDAFGRELKVGDEIVVDLKNMEGYGITKVRGRLSSIDIDSKGMPSYTIETSQGGIFKDVYKSVVYENGVETVYYKGVPVNRTIAGDIPMLSPIEKKSIYNKIIKGDATVDEFRRYDADAYRVRFNKDIPLSLLDMDSRSYKLTLPRGDDVVRLKPIQSAVDFIADKLGATPKRVAEYRAESVMGQPHPLAFPFGDMEYAGASMVATEGTTPLHVMGVRGSYIDKLDTKRANILVHEGVHSREQGIDLVPIRREFAKWLEDKGVKDAVNWNEEGSPLVHEMLLSELVAIEGNRRATGFEDIEYKNMQNSALELYNESHNVNITMDEMNQWAAKTVDKMNINPIDINKIIEVFDEAKATSPKEPIPENIVKIAKENGISQDVIDSSSASQLIDILKQKGSQQPVKPEVVIAKEPTVQDLVSKTEDIAYLEWYKQLDDYNKGLRPESIWSVLPEEAANRLNKLALSSNNPKLYNRAVEAVNGKLSLDQYKQFVKDAVQELFSSPATKDVVRQYTQSYMALKDKYALDLGKDLLPRFNDDAQFWVNIDAMKRAGITDGKIRQAANGMMSDAEYLSIMGEVIERNVKDKALYGAERLQAMAQDALSNYKQYRDVVREKSIINESLINLPQQGLDSAMDIVAQNVDMTTALIDRALLIPELAVEARLAKTGLLGLKDFRKFISKAEEKTGFLITKGVDSIPYYQSSRMAQGLEQVNWRLNGLRNRIDDMVYILGQKAEPNLRRAELVARNIQRFTDNLSKDANTFFTGYSDRFKTMQNLQDKINIGLGKANELYEAVASKSWGKASEAAQFLKVLFTGYSDNFLTFRAAIEIADQKLFAEYLKLRSKGEMVGRDVRDLTQYIASGISKVNAQIKIQTDKTWGKIQPKIQGAIDKLSEQTKSLEGALSEFGTLMDSGTRARLDTAIMDTKEKLSILKQNVVDTTVNNWNENRGNLLRVSEDLNNKVSPIMSEVSESLRSKVGMVMGGVAKASASFNNSIQRLNGEVTRLAENIANQTTITWNKAKGEISNNIDRLNGNLRNIEQNLSEVSLLLDSATRARIEGLIGDTRIKLDTLKIDVANVTGNLLEQNRASLLRSVEDINANVTPVLIEAGEKIRQQALVARSSVIKAGAYAFATVTNATKVIVTEATKLSQEISKQTVATWDKAKFGITNQVNLLNQRLVDLNRIVDEFGTLLDSSTRARIEEVVNEAKIKIDSLSQDITNIAGDAWEINGARIIQLSDDIANNVMSKLDNVIESSKANIGVVINNLNKVVLDVSGRASNLSSIIAQSTKNTWQNVSINVTNLIGELNSDIRNIKQSYDNLSNIMESGVRARIGESINDIESKVSDLSDSIRDITQETFDAKRADLLRVVEDLNNKTYQLATDIQTQLSQRTKIISDVIQTRIMQPLSLNASKLANNIKQVSDATGQYLSGVATVTRDNVLRTIDSARVQINEMQLLSDELGRVIENNLISENLSGVLRDATDNLNSLYDSVQTNIADINRDVVLGIADKLVENQGRLIELSSTISESARMMSRVISQRTNDAMLLVKGNLDNISKRVDELTTMIKQSKVVKGMESKIDSMLIAIQKGIDDTKGASEYLGNQLSSESYAKFNEALYALDKFNSNVRASWQAVAGKTGAGLNKARISTLDGLSNFSKAINDTTKNFDTYVIDIAKGESLGSELMKQEKKAERIKAAEEAYSVWQERKATERVVKNQILEDINKVLDVNKGLRGKILDGSVTLEKISEIFEGVAPQMIVDIVKADDANRQQLGRLTAPKASSVITQMSRDSVVRAEQLYIIRQKIASGVVDEVEYKLYESMLNKDTTSESLATSWDFYKDNQVKRTQGDANAQRIHANEMDANVLKEKIHNGDVTDKDIKEYVVRWNERNKGKKPTKEELAVNTKNWQEFKTEALKEVQRVKIPADAVYIKGKGGTLPVKVIHTKLDTANVDISIRLNHNPATKGIKLSNNDLHITLFKETEKSPKLYKSLQNNLKDMPDILLDGNLYDATLGDKSTQILKIQNQDELNAWVNKVRKDAGLSKSERLFHITISADKNLGRRSGIADIESAEIVDLGKIAREKPEGTLIRYLTPAERRIPFMQYHVSPDITPILEAIRQHKPVVIGYTYDKAGNLVKIPANELYTSSQIAYDRYYNILEGKKGKNPGVIAIALHPDDLYSEFLPVRKTDVKGVKELGIQTPFGRIGGSDIQWSEILLDEWSAGEGTTLYGFVNSKGMPIEIDTRHPITRDKMPIYYLTTERGLEAGLRPPPQVVVREVAINAMKEKFKDLTHPHLAKEVIINNPNYTPLSEVGLLEFYQRETPFEFRNALDSERALDAHIQEVASKATDKVMESVKKQWFVDRPSAEFIKEKYNVDIADIVDMDKHVEAALRYRFEEGIGEVRRVLSETDNYWGDIRDLNNAKMAKEWAKNRLKYEDEIAMGKRTLDDDLLGLIADALIQDTLVTLKSKYAKIDITPRPTMIEGEQLTVGIDITGKGIKGTAGVIPTKTVIETLQTTGKTAPISTTSTPVIPPTPTTTPITTPTTPITPPTTPVTPPTTPITPPTTPTTPPTTPTTPPLTPTTPPITTTTTTTITSIGTKPFGKIPKGEKRTWEELTREEKLASIVWKQGWAYWCVYPPFLQNNLIYSNKPFAGTKIHHGPKSAYKSVAKVKGAELPEKIELDLGIMDIIFQKDDKGKDVRIYYRADPKQKTTGQGPTGWPVSQVHRTSRTTQVSSVG